LIASINKPMRRPPQRPSSLLFCWCHIASKHTCWVVQANMTMSNITCSSPTCFAHFMWLDPRACVERPYPLNRQMHIFAGACQFPHQFHELVNVKPNPQQVPVSPNAKRSVELIPVWAVHIVWPGIAKESLLVKNGGPVKKPLNYHKPILAQDRATPSIHLRIHVAFASPIAVASLC